MANRSDFYTSKLPRQLKRVLGMAETYGFIESGSERGAIKKLFLEAHASHVAAKSKRLEMRDLGDGE